MKNIVCLIESKDGNWPNIPQPSIKGYEVATTTMVVIDGKNYEQLKFIKK